MVETLDTLTSSGKATVFGNEEADPIQFGLNVEGGGDILVAFLPLVGQHGHHLNTLDVLIVPHGLSTGTRLFVTSLDVGSGNCNLFSSNHTGALYDVSGSISQVLNVNVGESLATVFVFSDKSFHCSHI